MEQTRANVMTLTTDEIVNAEPYTLPWDFPVEKKVLTLDGEDSDRFAIRRSDSGKILGYCAADYEPVSYHKLIAPFVSWLSDNESSVEVNFTGAEDGRRGAWEILFGDTVAIERPEGTPTHPANRDEWPNIPLKRSVIVTAGHDAKSGIFAQAAIHNLICWNGLVVPHVMDTIRRRHVGWSDEEYGKQVDDLLSSVLASHDDALATFSRWVDTTAPKTAPHRLFREVMGTKGTFSKKWESQIAERLLAESARESSLWDLYMTLTDRTLDKGDNPFRSSKMNARAFEIVDGVFADMEDSGKVVAQ